MTTMTIDDQAETHAAPPATLPDDGYMAAWSDELPTVRHGRTVSVGLAALAAGAAALVALSGGLLASTLTKEPAPALPAPVTKTVAAPAPPAQPDIVTAADRALLRNLVERGFMVSDPVMALGTGHSICVRLHEGEPVDQVNREIAHFDNATLASQEKFTAAAMAAYPDCP